MSLCAACPKPGQCCAYLYLPLADIAPAAETTFIPLARRFTPDEIAWVNLHPGVTMSPSWPDRVLVREEIPFVVITGQPGMPAPRQGKSLRLDVACSALKPNGTCAFFGTPRRPALCSNWPETPDQVADLEGCAYAGRLIPVGA